MSEKPTEKQGTDDPSSKMQVYLAKIYRLADFATNENGFVTTSALADALLVTAPAVNRMINRLKEGGLLEHEPYKGIRLTPEGRKEALLYLRNQRIAEVFLTQVMGLDWVQAYEEAANLSLSISDAIVQRMVEMAGYPRYCPHGEPIPQADGTIEDLHDQPLSQASANQTVHITRLKTRESDRLKYMEALGLMPNTEVAVLHVAPFNGPMQLKIKNEYRIIGSNLAELIRVRVIPS